MLLDMSSEDHFSPFCVNVRAGTAPGPGVFLPHMGVLSTQDMTLEEKLQAMEELWESLSSNEALVEVPDWHLDALRVTEADVQAGHDQLLEWDAAKADLRKRAE